MNGRRRSLRGLGGDAASVFIFAVASVASAADGREAVNPSPESPTRLVVFELFTRPTSGNCVAAGLVVDQLAVKFADQPVIFVEDNVDHPMGQRIDRWWAAYGTGGIAYLPLVLLDSGHKVLAGPVLDEFAVTDLIDDELSRPPTGQVEAYSRRLGNSVRIYARLTTGPQTAPLGPGNDTTFHALVWEDAPIGTTGRTLRAAPFVASPAVVTAGGDWAVTLDTGQLAPLDWAKLHAVAFVDYRPGGSTGPYDTIQASTVTPADFNITPNELSADLEHGDGIDLIGSLHLFGPHVLSWAASTDVLWLQVSPGAGRVPSQVDVRVVSRRLPTGAREAHVTIVAESDDGMIFTRTIPITVRVSVVPSRHLHGSGQ